MIVDAYNYENMPGEEFFVGIEAVAKEEIRPVHRVVLVSGKGPHIPIYRSIHYIDKK